MNLSILRISLLAIVGIAVSVPCMAQQRRNKDRLREQYAERYGMPPDILRYPIFSPGGVDAQAGYTSVQINVSPGGLNIVGDAANEPSFVIDPTNPLRMAVGWRQFDSIASNFREGGYAYTTDGGLHWTFPGVLENNVFRSDPVLDSTSGGIFHYNSLQNTFYTDEFSSLNWGLSWNKLGPSTGGDKQWIRIDRKAGASNGFIYQAWSTAGNNYGGRQFSRSTNGGSVWMDPINLPDQPVWGVMDIGLNSELYLVGTDGSQPSLRFLRSSNAKNGAVTPSFDMSVFVDMNGDLSYGAAVNPAGLSGQAWIACDNTPTSPFAGNLYILASIDSSLGSNNRVDVKLRRSTNGGSSWQPVQIVNDDGSVTNRYHWFGTLSVAPNGRVDVCWLDTRHDATAATSKLYYTYSTDGGVTFKPNIAVSSAFNSTVGWPQQNKIGDYMAMISDNTGANIVYPATFNNEQDVYFVRVPQTGTVSGNVNLEFLSNHAGQTATMEFRTPSTTTVVHSGPITLDTAGNYSISGVPLGVYDVAVKFSHWLRKVAPSVAVNTTTTGVNLALVNGDSFFDNVVDLYDLNKELVAFGGGSPDPTEDLDADGDVDVYDLNIVFLNFGMVGST